MSTRLLALTLQHFLTTVETRGRNVVTQMRFARRGFHGKRGIRQKIVGAMHTALRGGLLVLLNGHFKLQIKNSLALL
jgi:hypothetical protein